MSCEKLWLKFFFFKFSEQPKNPHLMHHSSGVIRNPHILLKAVAQKIAFVSRTFNSNNNNNEFKLQQQPPPEAQCGGKIRPCFITTLPWKAVYNADPSAPSKRPSLNVEVESVLDAAHAFLYIKRLLLLHFSELAWWCHLLMTTASLSNLSPSALCSCIKLLSKPCSILWAKSTKVTEHGQPACEWSHSLTVGTFYSNVSSLSDEYGWLGSTYQSLQILTNDASFHVGS